jgi:hypothetical protein
MAKGKIDESVNELNGKLGSIAKEIGEAIRSNFNASSFSKIIVDLDNQATTIAKSFGQGREQIDNIKKGLADAVFEAKQMGKTMQDVLDLQQSVTSSIGRNVLLTTESLKGLFAAADVSGQGIDTILNKFKDVGISTYQASQGIQTVVDKSREIGVSAVAVSSQVLQNTDMMNKYTFQGGVEGLAKMAAQAVNMRINISDVANTIEKAFNPESAIEMAASLQRLGVAQSDLLDPLRLMNLAQNDPAELQNQLAEMSKQFVTLNEQGQFEILPGAKRQLREVEQALGMSQGTLSKMALSSAELDTKLSKIKFPDTFTEEQKKMIANMSEIGPGGEFKLKVDGQDMGIQDAIEMLSHDSNKMTEFLKASEPKSIEEMQGEQLDFTKRMTTALEAMRDRLPYALASSRIVTDKMTTARDVSKAVTTSINNENLNIGTIRDQFSKLYDGLKDSISSEDGGLQFNFQKMSSTVSDFSNYVNTTLTTTFQKLNTEVEKSTGFNMVNTIKQGEEKVKSVVKTTGNDVLKYPGSEVQLHPQDTFLAMTNGDNFMKNLEMMSKVMNQSTPTTQNTLNETKNSSDITLNIKVDSNLPEAKLIEVLNKTEVIQSLNRKLKDAMQNNGLMV